MSFGRVRIFFPLSTVATCSRESVFCSMASEPWMVRMRLARYRVGLIEGGENTVKRPTSSVLSAT